MKKISKDSRIAFIGTGVMGKSMASNIMAAGYQVAVYSRTKQKAEELLGKGAVWADSPKGLAALSDVIISMVGYPHDVEEIYLGPEGIINHGKEDIYLIDMTTSKPSLAKEIYIKEKEKGTQAIDDAV